jgi:hypothetical protein
MLGGYPETEEDAETVGCWWEGAAGWVPMHGCQCTWVLVLGCQWVGAGAWVPLCGYCGCLGVGTETCG